MQTESSNIKNGEYQIKDTNGKKKSYDIFFYWKPFLLTVAILTAIFWSLGFAPFGNKSVATLDANVQFLDLFAFIKDVIAGDNSLAYSFSKGLGGNSVAVFSYYLSSPFTLLVAFFEKENLTLFFNVLMVLKLGVASVTMSIFLKCRFNEKLNNTIVLLLSVSYSLMQYSLAQAFNTMWLDGVYMLPLMLLGVYKLVKGEKPYLLIFSTACAVVFNWYTAGINCIFTGIWVCLEYSLTLETMNDLKSKIISNELKRLGIYVVSMLTGVLLAAFLFIPSLAVLSTNGRGHMDWFILKSDFHGNIINVIQNLTIGSVSDWGSVSLYCGTLAILGTIGFFVSRKNTNEKKIKLGITLLLCILIFYWQPLYAVFSLFKVNIVFMYRYSYVTIFLLIFIAGNYYSEVDFKDNSEIKALIKGTIVYVICMLLLEYINPIWELKRVYYTCGLAIIVLFLVYYFFITLENNKKNRGVAVVMLFSIIVAELAYNANIILQRPRYFQENVQIFHDYSVNQQTQISQLKDYDSGNYRISQLKTYRFDDFAKTTANYNEAYAYNYHSIATYTSDPMNTQRNLLDKLGYRINGDNMNITNTSILASDALLGVKYVLSPDEINGLKLVDSLGKFNDKNVYENPYALPMAFVYSENDISMEVEDLNPFEYQNMIYSKLTGTDVKLYTPVNFLMHEEPNRKTFTLDLPVGNYAVYGNITWNKEMDAWVDINHTNRIKYSSWVSPSVFYIPTKNGDTVADVAIDFANNEMNEAQFYALNLDELKLVSEELQSKEADLINIENGNVRIEATGNVGETLFTSIPYDIGWTIKLNGKKIEPEHFEDCLISIPLEDGENVIEMEYSVPSLKTGILISCLTLIMLIYFKFNKKRP